MAWPNVYDPASGVDAQTRAEALRAANSMAALYRSIGSEGSASPVRRNQGPLDALREVWNTRPTFLGGVGEQQAIGSPMDALRGVAADFPSWQQVNDFGNQNVLDTVFNRGSQQEPDDFNLQQAINSVAPSIMKMVDKYGVAVTEQADSRASDQAFDENYFKDAYSRAKAAWEQPYNAEKEQISAEYGDRIMRLQQELTGYQGGLEGVNAAYGSYADDANAILSKAAAVEAEALPDSAVVAEVDRTYAEHDGEMQAMLSKIDGTGNVALAQAMSVEVTRMQEIVTDGLRSDLGTQSELHRLAGAQAQALAHMAWKDDVYQAERSRFQLELEINQAINNKANGIEEVRAAMDRAIANVNDEAGTFDIDPEELWAKAMADFARTRGMTDVEVGEMNALWDGIMENPAAAVNYNTFKSELQYAVNMEAMAQLGLGGQIAAFLQAKTDTPEAAAAQAKLNEMLMTMDVKALIPAINKYGGLMGIRIPTDIDVGDAASIADTMYSSMLDLWGHHDDYVTNYNDYQQRASAATQTSYTGRQAPDNWNRRYQPEYRYRREVASPQFAQRFNASFGSVKADGKTYNVGGLGWMRDPRIYGGAANSDHQSGGAVDLYGTSFQQLKDIERWAKSQPGVSLVIYSGNSKHETGNLESAHVHVSLLLGYNWGTA